MKINIPLLILIILTLSFSSCSKKEESTTAATAATPSAAITGETMSIGSIDYTTSLMSNCMDADTTSDAGVALYFKTQFWIYDNGTAIFNENYYSGSTCTTFVSSFVIDGDNYDSPVNISRANASTQYKSTKYVFNDATVKDYSGNTIDNSSYHLLLYDGTCENGTGQGYRLIYPTSSTVIEMTSEQCTTETSFDTTDNKTMTEKYTSQ